jgi:hypothetical protein
MGNFSRSQSHFLKQKEKPTLGGATLFELKWKIDDLMNGLEAIFGLTKTPLISFSHEKMSKGTRGGRKLVKNRQSIANVKNEWVFNPIKRIYLLLAFK